MQRQTLWEQIVQWFSGRLARGDSQISLVEWLIVAGFGLLALLLVLLVLRLLWRAAFGRKAAPAVDWDRELREDLSGYPPPGRAPAETRLTVYHLPVRLRLVVAAPAGTEADVDGTAIERLLDQVVPGLGGVARHDQPRIRIWPPQLSQHGFAASFYRRTLVPEPDGQPSHWILLAGRVALARKTVLLGLALWADDANALGRREIEAHQWVDVLRLKNWKG